MIPSLNEAEPLRPEFDLPYGVLDLWMVLHSIFDLEEHHGYGIDNVAESVAEEVGIEPDDVKKIYAEHFLGKALVETDLDEVCYFLKEDADIQPLRTVCNIAGNLQELKRLGAEKYGDRWAEVADSMAVKAAPAEMKEIVEQSRARERAKTVTAEATPAPAA